MTTQRRIVLVGESNPYGEDPRYALYDEPKNFAGGRLRRLIFGLRRTHYFGHTDRYNLCTGPWSVLRARERANEILRAHASEVRDDTIVLLGRKVVGAFFGGPESLAESDWPRPFTYDHLRYAPLGGCATKRERENLVILPHPSGRNREWNTPGAFERARGLLKLGEPDIPWGSIDIPVVVQVFCTNCGKPTTDNICSDCGFDQGGGFREE